MSERYGNLNRGHKGAIADPCTPYTAKQAIRLCKIQKGDRVLDYGCSVGCAAKEFHEHGCTVVGVDVIPEYLDEAKPFCHKTFLRADQSEALPFEEGSFDVVYSSQVIEHLHRRDGDSLIAEAYALLRGGGGYFSQLPIRTTSMFWPDGCQ